MLSFLVSAKMNDEDSDVGMVEPDEFSLKDLWNLAFNVTFGFDIHNFRMELLPTGIEPPYQAIMHLGDLIFADDDANADGLNMDENDNAGDMICLILFPKTARLVTMNILKLILRTKKGGRGVHIKGRPFAVRAGGIIDLQQRQLFNDVHHFREVLLDFTIQEDFALSRVKNDTKRVIVKCKDEGCSWRVYASPTSDKVTYKIKIYNGEHSCQKINKNVEANLGWIVKRYGPLIRSNPNIKFFVLATDLREKFRLAIPTWTLYRAKQKAVESSGEDLKAAYKKLYKYGNIVRIRNSGSTALLKVHRPALGAPAQFQRFFLIFYGQKAGFLAGCKPFVRLNGCHLKGLYGGVLLTVVTIDANCGVFPIAVFVVEIENNDSWGWFLMHLFEHIGMEERRRVCFMSDRQKSVLIGLEKFWPNSWTRYCCRHIYANFKTRYPGLQLRNLFWAAAKCSNLIDFNVVMNELKTIDLNAYAWLMEISPTHWCRHGFDESIKVDHVTNNITESFNGWLNQYRTLPILTFMEEYRRKIMRRIQKMHDQCIKWETILPPVIHKRLKVIKKEARHIIPIWAAEDEYEVKDISRHYIVKLNSQQCECGLWQVSGLPCKHVVACINAWRRDLNDYVHNYLKNEACLKTYSFMIHPIPTESTWPDVEANDNVLPLVKKRLPGRPKLARRREVDEQRRDRRSNGLKCGLCREFGHNRRSCSRNPDNMDKRKTSQS
ncbi:hypothetical protein EZV62_015468 [Acer yangbiense]|uniref:SWIM-type domain-containing protein n=1 Tax=Acer yangbiense TaxID=1000413 RepID=A0A5C7HLI6_9ROSI|nr:hypothetical protein EZV62_015468 [Acer yangbiense]